jgi:legumain
MRLPIIHVLFYSIAGTEPNFWAVLVAGSRGFANYRHQADLCHTHIFFTESLRVNPSRVVVMMYDDIAWSNENPLIGRLYNEPNGTNVYQHCSADYRASEVSLENLDFVLSSGKEPSSYEYYGRKRIHSDHTSTVFLSFVDHGEPGGLLFPNGQTLSGNKFLDIVNRMKNRYAQLVVYIEACYAGSVFDDIQLPDNVIVITASNATESSWGTFCPTAKHPSADVINGIHVGSCLADLFEISWKRDLENRLSIRDFNISFGEHLHAVKLFVAKKSNVMMYGDLGLLNKPLHEIFPFPSATANLGLLSHLTDSDIILDSAEIQKRSISPILPETHTLPLLAV